MRFLIFFIVYVVSFFNAYSQKSDGYIVVLKQGLKADYLKSFTISSVDNRASNTIKSIAKEPLNAVLIKSSMDENDLIKGLNADPNILLWQKNHIIRNRKIPNDSLFKNQWQYINDGSQNGVVDADLDIENAWDITTGGVTATGDTIVVAIVDDGFDGSHPDLWPNLYTNQNEISDGIDNDGNGFIDDIHGWNFEDDNSDVFAGGGHGSPVAGIVGAKGNNSIGVAGVNWDVKLLPINYGSVSEANAVASYAYAYSLRKMYNESNGTKGAFIVATNSSWGTDFGKAEDAPIWCAMYDSLGSVGILSMGATANVNVDVDKDGDLPTSCNSEYLISVTNLNRSDKKVNSAGYGKISIDLGSYGSSAYTVARGGNYTSFGGTSGATPHVTGAVALLYSIPCEKLSLLAKSNPSAAASLVKEIILNTTTPLDALNNITTTNGKLNVGDAVEKANAICNECPIAYNITSKSLNPNQVQFVWMHENPAHKLNLRYRLFGAPDWIETTQLSSGSIISGLDVCKVYEFQVRDTCYQQNYGFSRYVETKGCCRAPEIPEVSVEGNLFMLSNMNEGLYLAEYKEYGSSKWDSLIYNDNAIIDLKDNCKLFECRVSSSCIDSFSNPTKTFTINSQCASCTELSYCPAPLISNIDEWIDSIVINDAVFYSGKNAKSYGAFMGTFIPIFNKKDTVNFKFCPGYKDQSFREYFTAYIDFDKNGEFEESELIFDVGNTTTTCVNGKFFVPDTIAEGLTRMRVVMTYNKKSTACAVVEEYGEIEDYCVKIDKTLGIENENEEGEITILPNPVSESFTLNVPEFSSSFSIEILDLTGRKIMSKMIENKSNKIIIDHLPSGVYLLNYKKGNNNIKTTKFVKI